MTRADMVLRDRQRNFAGRRINWPAVVAYGGCTIVWVIIFAIAWCMWTGVIQP